MSGSESKPKPAMPLWLLLLTLLGGAFLVQRGNQPPEDKGAVQPVASRASSAADTAAAEDRTLAPLREFLGLAVQPSRPAEPPAVAKLQLEKTLPDSSRAKVLAEWVGKTPAQADASQAELKRRIRNNVGLLEFLIVMVADPIETSTNYRFDLQLDTLHKALGTEGYLPDHYYLPWGTPEKPNAHRTEPGVLLYRSSGRSLCDCTDQQGRTDLLLVYLVGETPTSGIHKEAFLTAVKQIESLGKMACPPEPKLPHTKPVSEPTIRVAGPLFSGAADSLALAIRQTRQERLTTAKFQVITGTAVSIDTGRFESLAGKEVDLHSTVLSGSILKQALIDHVLQRTWSKKVRIAWLVETGTGYGSSSSRDKTTLTTASPSGAEILEFRFPVNISKVRSGYAESRRRERSAQASLGPESSRLPIPFEDTSTARDVPPMQTPKVTAPTVELILNQILTTIRNEGIKYVGISFSDPRDPIFLAELIKEQCPDVQIMLVTSDLLHMHSEYRSIMHGTLVSSTQPLNPEAQDWCFPFGETQGSVSRSAVMSSQSNYGLYNAVLFLRGMERGHYAHAHPAGHEEGHDDASENLITLSFDAKDKWPDGLPLGYSMPFEKNIFKRLRPPVWISRISPTGICPITVRPTGEEDRSEYTFDLEIVTPPENAPPLPAPFIRSRIPTSLYIASLTWLIIASVYCLALMFPKLVGNWAKALTRTEGQPKEFQSLIFVFRSYITGSFVYVLLMFGTLMYVHYRWADESSWGDYLFRVFWGVASILTLCLLYDWLRGSWGLIVDTNKSQKDIREYLRSKPAVDWRQGLRRLVRKVFGEWKRLLTHLRSGTAERARNRRRLTRSWKWLVAHLKRGLARKAGDPDLSLHLITARGAGLTIILVLVAIHVSATIWQRVDWYQHPEDSFLWFKHTSDMWNGLSPAMTAQFLAVGLIILAYGMLLQMHLLSPEFTILRPHPLTSAPPSNITPEDRLEEVRSSLLFPLLNRWRRDRPVVLDLLCVTAALLWLSFLAWHTQSPDYCALPVSFPTTLLLIAGGFWCVRFFKLIQILKGLARHLDEMTKNLRDRWPKTWPKIFELLPDKRAGLQELFWTSRPTVDDGELENAKQKLQGIPPGQAGRLDAEQKLCAIEIELYVRQFFHHIVRLGFGLAVSASLLFLSAQSFPYSQEPLLRLSASIMLASIGCVMAWYYLKFDRNELLSYLVGTDPKQVSINWSMIQMIAPAFLLTVVALLSHTFPDLWQWLRGVIEPMARSSI